jgi:hypothetical protein
MHARRKLRKMYKINQVDSFILSGPGCRNTALDKEQEQLSLVTQDSKVQVLERDQRARLDLHSEYCSKGLSTMSLVEVESSPDHETDLTERYTVSTKMSREYDWWTKLKKNERRQNSYKTVTIFPSGSSDAPAIINWSGKWRPYDVNTTLGSSSSCLGLIACEKLSLSYNHVEETGRKTALTSIGSEQKK